MQYQVKVTVRYIEMNEEQETAWRAAIDTLYKILVEYDQETKNQPLLAAPPEGASSKGTP